MTDKEDPPGLNTVPTSKDLVYLNSNTPALRLCRPCHVCSGTGRNQNSNVMHDPTRTLQGVACQDCGGQGYFKEFVTLEDLYLVMVPHMLAAFERKIPELIARLPYEIVREIMES